MKLKNKLFTLLLLLSFTSMTTSAKDVSVITIFSTDKNSFILRLSNTTAEQIQVTLKDNEGAILHEETIMQSGLKNRKYNLRNLPLGKYLLMVAYDDVIKVQPIKKENKILKIEAEEMQTIFQPTFTSHPEHIDLDMPCLTDAKVLLKIMDKDGNVIYKEKTQSNGRLKRRFDLSQLEEGDYIFYVKVIDTLINEGFSELIHWSPSLDAVTAL